MNKIKILCKKFYGFPSKQQGGKKMQLDFTVL